MNLVKRILYVFMGFSINGVAWRIGEQHYAGIGPMFVILVVVLLAVLILEFHED